MKARKILSALLAAAVMTTTAAYAEEVSTDEKTMVTTIGDKGNVMLSDEESAALVDAMIEYMQLGEDTTLRMDGGIGVIDENTVFSVEDCNCFDIDKVNRVSFSLLHIDINDDGTMKISNVETCINAPIVGSCYWIVTDYMLGYNYPKKTIQYSEIAELFKDNLDFAWQNYAFSDNKYANEDEYTTEQMALGDMFVINFFTTDIRTTFNEHEHNQDFVYHSNDDTAKYYWSAYLTENGAEKLGNYSASSGNDVVSTPAAEFEAAEAISADDFAELLSANAEADVTVKTENGVSFTFEKGTMAAIDGVESYDFSSVINTTYDAEKNSAIKEKDFVLSIDYSYSGKLPAKSSITIPVGTEYAGKTLYYSQILESGVKLISSAVVDDNGNITVIQEHCSEYVLSTTNPESGAVVDTDAAVDTGKGAVDTGVEGVAAVASLALMAGAAIMLSRKKR